MKCSKCGSEVLAGGRFCANCGAPLVREGMENEAGPLFCRHCGARLPERANYCTRCGKPVTITVEPERILRLAGWGERFVAWLLDVIILGVALMPMKWLLLSIGWPGLTLAPGLPRWMPFVELGFDNLIQFLYWAFLEGSYGESIGKMVMRIKVSRLDGKPAEVTRAVLESLGKAFLLPIDCIIGWLLYGEKNQRLFNYVSETIVVKA